MSYVMLSGLGLMPLQLLNLGTVFIIGLYRVLFTRTPRGQCTERDLSLSRRTELTYHVYHRYGRIIHPASYQLRLRVSTCDSNLYHFAALFRIIASDLDLCCDLFCHNL